MYNHFKRFNLRIKSDTITQATYKGNKGVDRWRVAGIHSGVVFIVFPEPLKYFLHQWNPHTGGNALPYLICVATVNVEFTGIVGAHEKL